MTDQMNASYNNGKKLVRHQNEMFVLYRKDIEFMCQKVRNYRADSKTRIGSLILTTERIILQNERARGNSNLKNPILIEIPLKKLKNEKFYQPEKGGRYLFNGVYVQIDES